MEIERSPNQIKRLGSSELADWSCQYAHVGVSGITLKGTGSGSLLRSAILQFLVGQEGVDMSFFADDAAQEPREVSTAGHEISDPLSGFHSGEAEYFDGFTPCAPGYLLRGSVRVSHRRRYIFCGSGRSLRLQHVPDGLERFGVAVL